VRKLLIAVGLLGGLAITISAQASMSCSPSGDACATVTAARADALLQLDSLVPLVDPGACVLPSVGSARCVPLGPVSVRRTPAPLYMARLRVPSATLDLPAGSYLVQFGVRGALIGSPLRLRIGPAQPDRPGLRVAAPSEVTIGQQTTLTLGGLAGAASVRVLLSPLPGGGSCCGISVAAATRRLGAERLELRFAWPRTYFRCGGVQQCTRVPCGRRGRMTLVSDPVGDVVARDVSISQPSTQRRLATLSRLDAARSS
jgi:hypothetical protein